jgi:hypothetical protein
VPYEIGKPILESFHTSMDTGITIASSHITFKLISLLEGAWTHGRFRSWLLVTRDYSRSGLLCTNAPRAHNAPQVTHDRPQIFPLTASTRFRVSKPRTQSSKSHSFSTDNRHDGVFNRNHYCRDAKDGAQKLSTCQAESEPSVRSLPPHANKM